MTLLPINNWSPRKRVGVFLLATGLSVCIFQLAYRSQAAGTRDSNSNLVANATKSANNFIAPAGSTYTWMPLLGSTDWQVPTNWSPTRPSAVAASSPITTDILIFDGNVTPTPTVTNVPTQTIATLSLVNNNIGITLNASTLGAQTLTLSTNLSVSSGTLLTVAGGNALTIALSSGCTGTIGGQIILQNAAHKVLASDANGITFQNGSIFTTSTGFTGNPFGTGTDGSVVFQSGSSAFFNAGGDPFGGAGHSIATFTLGSSQTFNTTTAFSSDGRTYGNLTLDGSQSYAGSGTGLLTIFNTLTIASGSTLTLSSSSGGNLNLLGNITINGTLNTNGRAVQFQGGGIFGGDIQNITNGGTFGDVIISKSVGSVVLGNTTTINGALQFDGSSSAVDVIDLSTNTLNLNGTVGGTSSSAANGFRGSPSSILNIGGTGALGILRFISGTQSLRSLSVNRTSSGSVTLGTNLTIVNPLGGTLALTNGVVDMGSNTLSLAASSTITRTNGYVIGNLQKTFGATGSFTFTVGTANGYSPVDANVTTGVGSSLTVKAIQGKHPAFTGANALLRYWTLSNSGSVTANLTFHYLGADVAGLEANYKVFKYDGSFTQPPNQSVNTVAHTATVNGVSSFSDWTLDNLPTLSIDNVSVNEGTGAGTTNFTFTVTKTGSTPLTATVNFATAPGTTNPATGNPMPACASGFDYQSKTGNLSFAPSDTTKTITVLVCKDAVFEADETFFVNLSGETNTTLTKNQGVGTILNDDDPPTTIVVNSTNDVNDTICDGTHCSLREAINLANITPNPVTINFAIPAGDLRHFYYKDDGVANQVTLANVTTTTTSDDSTLVGALTDPIDPDWPHSWWSILPTSALPTVTQAVVIDGYTQTGATANSLATSDNAVLRVELDGISAGATGLKLSGATSVLRGLAINRFNGDGVSFQGGNGSSVTGNFIGTDVSGTLDLGNTVSGVSCIGNSITIGGSTPARMNLISGNDGDGILITNSNNHLILGNLIGTKANGSSALGTSASGINFSGSSSATNTVGGTNAGEGNTIAFNGADGVRLADAGTGNTLRGNSIFSNGSTANDLAIDLGTDGVTANDSKDPDSGPNNLQNFPLITRAVTGATNIIQGTLNSTPGQAFTIDFYANSSCDTLGGNGEGKTYLGSITTAATDGTTGDVSFTFNPGSLTAGQVITATATDSTGNTSEFSACFTAVAGAPGTIQFAAANTNDTETNSGSHTANIAVTRSGGDGAVNVNYAVTNGTATTADNDYSISPSTGTLTWVDQDTSTKFITITVNGDTKVELNETVNLTLSSATGGASIGGTNPATLTIVNDDCVTSLTVNNNGDTGDASPGDGVCETASGNGICTLRAAIQETNASGSFCGAIEINFSISTPNTINVGSGPSGTPLPSIAHNVNINGPGASLLTVQRSKAGGTPQFRIFTIQNPITVTISGLAISNGNLASGSNGGGILNSGMLTLISCNVFGNSVATTPTNFGGGIYNSGASLTLNNSNVGGTSAGQANTATDGGGIYNLSGTVLMTSGSIVGNSGGGIANVFGGTITLKSVAITNNASITNGLTGGVDNAPLSTAKIVNCLIANNSAATAGGGVYNGGTATLINTTISGNSSAVSGGGIMNQGSIVNSNPTIGLTNVTVTNNRSDSDNSGAEMGGGIFRAGGTVTVKNTVVAGNVRGPGSTADDISGTVDATSSFNLIGTGGSGGLINGTNNNQVGVGSPLLAPLANYGGPTMTHALLPGSPAINAGSNANLPADTFDLDGDGNTAELLPVDQRGTGFPRISNTTVDIGAFESGGFTISPTSGSGQSATITTVFSSPLVATVISNVAGEPVAGGQVTFTAPASGASATFPGSVITTNVAINGSGVATSPTLTANGTPGSYSVTASGNGISSSAAFSLTNTQAATSTSVASSANPSDSGQTVTFTATVSSTVGTPTGTVQFMDGVNNLGSATCVAGAGNTCTAQVSTLNLTPGNHSISATYSGDANFVGSNNTLSGGQVVRASLSINDVSITEGDSGTKTLNFTVTLSAASNLQVTVDFSTANGTATAPSDYSAMPLTTLTFAPGVLSQPIGITINGDQLFEPNETFFVNLSNPTNATISDNQGLGTIVNDDAQGGIISLSQTDYPVSEAAGFVTITVNRSGDTTRAATVDYATDDTGAPASCATFNGFASSRCDFTTALGTLKFAANETQKTFVVLVNRDSYVEAPSEAFKVTLSNLTGGAVFATPSSATVTITDSAAPAPNAIDDTDTFVRMHYHDFLNREADSGGLNFWKNEITSCGSNAQCIEVKRINVSAAFFLSIEFQGTGYLVERIYKAAYGDASGASSIGGAHSLPVPVVRFIEFLPDTQQIGQGVVVLQGNWEQQLEDNKNAFTAEFVQRSRFTTAFPASMTTAQVVDKLNANAGNPLSPSERDQLVNSGKTRAQILRAVAEDPDLVNAEFNRAFVLMQYFGYLRRNPNAGTDADYSGYDFWLTKLNQFNGNFIQAEMVKAFISSSEYRNRFGP